VPWRSRRRVIAVSSSLNFPVSAARIDVGLRVGKCM